MKYYGSIKSFLKQPTVFITVFGMFMTVSAGLALATVSTYKANEFSQYCKDNPTICNKVDFKDKRTGIVSCINPTHQIVDIYVHAGDGQTLYELPHEGFQYTFSNNNNTVTVDLTTHKHDISYISVVCGGHNPTPTTTLTATPTITPTLTPTITPTLTPTLTPTITPTLTPTVTPTITGTVTPTATPTATITPTSTPSATITPTPGSTGGNNNNDGGNNDSRSNDTTGSVSGTSTTQTGEVLGTTTLAGTGNTLTSFANMLGIAGASLVAIASTRSKKKLQK